MKNLERLKQEKRWIPHKDKRPLVKWSDPANWKRYDEVKGDKGLVLGGGIFGIDIDWKNQDEMPEQVMKLVNWLKSYAEISPSGKGIHILGLISPELKIVKARRKWSGIQIEIFHYPEIGGRYFTFTGKSVANYDLRDCTKELTELLKEVE